MKKILTTTLMTALLATSGFASENGKVAYSYVTFSEGTDTSNTIIMPSGDVNIGAEGKTPVIASTWELKESSMFTRNRFGQGFKLTGKIKINPNDAYTVPTQFDINQNGTLYYQYYCSGDYNPYYQLTNGTGCYVRYDGTAPEPQPAAADLKRSLRQVSSGLPVAFYDNGSGNRSNLLIDMTKKDSEGTEGSIIGGSVTYAKQGTGILSVDSTTNLRETSLRNTCRQYTLRTADKDGFTEGYLTDFAILKCDTNQLDLSDSTKLPSDKLATSESLKDYLASFGFCPNTVSFLSGTGFGVLEQKEETDAIQISQNYAFSQAASQKEYNIKTNLHNVDVSDFTSPLKFTGTGASDGGQDILVFSGDNSNLVPTKGVTYCNVNVTVCNANSWIAVPKDQIVTFQGDGSVKPVMSIKDDLSISHHFKIANGASIAIEATKTVKFFGNLTLGG